jgi:hypothetical protein
MLDRDNGEARGITMGWASQYIDMLLDGETVSFRPRGKSMSGIIESGQLCIVEPVDANTVEAGDVVLCRVNGSEYLHKVIIASHAVDPVFGEIRVEGKCFQIGNNHGRINGWIGTDKIFGKLKEVKP